ncbi:MAG: S-layer homology domain-containing protein [Candidatus Ornithomonoglobus sp.]
MKKITAIITAAIIAAVQLTAFSFDTQYYCGRQYSEISADSIKYEKYDTAEFDGILDELEKIVYYDGHDADVMSLLQSAYDGFCIAQEKYAIAQLQSDRYYSEENTAQYIEASDTVLEASKKTAKIIEKVYKSDYDYILENIFDDADELKEYVESLPSEHYYNLRKQELELQSKYSDVYGDSDACAEIYIQLVQLRNRIAAEQGYDNYADFANEAVYGRDYSSEDIALFSDAVIKYFQPLVRALIAPVSALGESSVSRSQSEVESEVGEVLSQINTELRQSYDYMTGSGLYDIAYSDKKSPAGGSYTITFPVLKAPYLYVTPNAPYEEDCTETVKSFIHEFGHFSALLNDPALENDWMDELSATSVDTCEIQSQGLELLAGRYYGRLFGKQSAAERYKQIVSKISIVLDGCFFNEWQTRVYEAENITIDECNALAMELIKKYYNLEYSTESAQKSWTTVPHNFTSPMYYISYAVSAASALEILGISYDDYERGVDTYMQLSALGAYVPYKEAVGKCGLKSVFDESVIKQTADSIIESCGLDYYDIDYSGWYAPYFYKVSDIFDGVGYKIFRPDYDITRSDFIKLIGRMYDAYSGIDNSFALTFSDVAEDDDSAPYIAWACANGIVTGYSDAEFGGEDTITREQLVTILYRLAKLENSETTGYRSPLDRFGDSEFVSEWAYDAVGWAVNAGVINGKDNNTLDPQGNATRAESAKIAACYIDIAY